MAAPARPSTWWHVGHNATHETYALTCDEFDELVIRSSGQCDRCGKPYRNLVIDHDHAVGQRGVRGLLCHSCNSLLGRIENRGAAMDVTTRAYLAVPFHSEIPIKRQRDALKQSRYAAAPAGHVRVKRARPLQSKRPRAGGRADLRNFRISDAAYGPAAKIAACRDEPLTDVVIRALEAYVKRHRREVEPDPETETGQP